MRMLSAQCIYSIWMTLRGSMTLRDMGRVMRHSAGLAAFLSSHARETDVLARYGGDEFVVIMKSMKKRQP